MNQIKWFPEMIQLRDFLMNQILLLSLTLMNSPRRFRVYVSVNSDLVNLSLFLQNTWNIAHKFCRPLLWYFYAAFMSFLKLEIAWKRAFFQFGSTWMWWEKRVLSLPVFSLLSLRSKKQSAVSSCCFWPFIMTKYVTLNVWVALYTHVYSLCLFEH